jgi:phosphatidylserine/phosphatidylglycerophosphate/cardiolipin synthase-like enzyme
MTFGARLALLFGLTLASAVAAGCSSSGGGAPSGGPSDHGGGVGDDAGADASSGEDAAPIARSCDPLGPRAPAPELLIGPTGLEKKILALIAAETTSIDVLIYEIDTRSIVDALVAAKRRGVAVRLVIERKENDAAKATFKSAGVDYRDSPGEFTFSHSKVMIFGAQAKALVMSGNLNDYSMRSERNYAVIDADRQDLADLRAIFERDWNGGGAVDVSCTKLVVSPLNSKQRLLAFIAGAQKTLDLGVMYMTDPDAVAAVKARAAAGVAVRVLLADPAWIAGNAQTAADLGAAKIPVKYMKALELHAKLVVADGAVFIGSENLSTNSLTNNREVGVLSNDPSVVAGAKAQLEDDWSMGVAP